MSQRLQVLLPQDEYQAIARASRKESKKISEWVRETLRARLTRSPERHPGDKLARILQYSRFRGPTGDIDQILTEIEKGRDNVPRGA